MELQKRHAASTPNYETVSVGENDTTQSYKMIIPPKFKLPPTTDIEKAAFEVNSALEEHPDKKFNLDTLLNITYMILLVGVGFGLVYISSELEPINFSGDLLFNGGLTPLLLSVWAFITGPRSFHGRNAIKMASSMFLVGVGSYLVGIQTKEEVTEAIGSVFFETGALFFISKMFFLEEDDESRIERLEKQLAEAMVSAGAGMALSYYYNFVLPTAANLNGKEEQNGKTPISMEVKRGVFEDYELQHSNLLIYVPRDLDGSDMKLFLRKITDTTQVIQGKPKDKPNAGSHRPMFVYFLEWNATDHTCDGLFDIPTIISSIWNRKQDQKELQVEPREELIIFQNYLWNLIQSNPITAARVKLVSVPPMPLEIIGMKLAARKLYSEDLQKMLN